MSHALMLLAHGSSDPHWRASFEHFAEALTATHPAFAAALAAVVAEQAGESARS